MELIQITVISLLCIIAGIAKAAMDVHSFRYQYSVFTKFKSLFFALDSWKNKYRDGDKSKGEKFLGSTTIFVFVTDIWHFAQFVYRLCLIVAALMFGHIEVITKHEILLSSTILYWINIVIGLLFIEIVSSLTFNLFYDKLLLAKTWKKK